MKLSTLLIFIALIAYHLPWQVHPTAAFTLNAYDLAEYASIHPAARYSTFPLLAPLMLRLPLAALALMLILQSKPALSWETVLHWMLAMILIVRLLPPPEFFISARDDPNYRQQFALSAGTFVSAALLLAFTRDRPTAKRAALIAICAAGAAAGLIGWGLASSPPLAAPVQNLGIGLGVPLTVLSITTFAVLRTFTRPPATPKSRSAH
jgi:hypothetical protein